MGGQTVRKDNMKSDCYKARRCYRYDDETKQIAERRYFIIAGEMADGTKCWYESDKEGNIESYDRWYSVGRINGKMVAFLEAED